MPEALEHALSVAIQNPLQTGIVVLLAVLAVAFVAVFLVGAVALQRRLGDLRRQIQGLKKQRLADPIGLKITDVSLAHLWAQYCESIHRPSGATDPRTGIAKPNAFRSTVPAEVVFNSESVVDGSLKTEFFKHLPGLLTGLGIIGTFWGLITGLGEFDGKDMTKLIGHVEGAFYVSAFAIGLAVVVTFLEKIIITWLHRTVEHLCQDIDTLYASAAGEEYLARLVHASEESASQARILKDALVGDLSTILERLTQQQIAAAAQQQAELRQHLVGAIDTGLKQPLGALAESFGQMRSQQGADFTQSLQDSMTAFAGKLDEILGGQVGQAKELQMQTLQALEKSIMAFQSMAQQVGHAGEAASTSMSNQLNTAIEDMAARQTQMTETMQSFVDQMRMTMTLSQAETGASVSGLLQQLSNQVETIVGGLRSHTEASTAVHRIHVDEMTATTKASITDLAEGVRAQTQAIEHATVAMRGTVLELGSSVNRNVALMAEGATEMRKAADQFSGAGLAIGDVFDRSKLVAIELSKTASSLSASSQDVQSVVADYRAARETFAGIVESLRGTVDTAKREVAMTSDLVARLESAAQKLIAAEGQADDYLAKINSVLAEAHSSFGTQMLETVKRTNTEFHAHLAKTTGLLAGTIAELDGVMVAFEPRRKHAS